MEAGQPSASSIRSFAPLQELTDAEAERLAQLLQPFRLAEGEPLFRQGDPAGGVYLVSSGAISVSLAVAGQADHPLATLGPGAILGEMSLLLDEPRSATAVAQSDTEVWGLDRPAFAAAVARGEPWTNRFLLEVARSLARRLTDLDRRLSELIAKTQAGSVDAPSARVAELEQLRQRLFRDWAF
jgi:CRP-like cAMP-binding protein